MSTTKKTMILGTVALTISACGGSNTPANEPVIITPPEEALRIFAKGNGDVGDVLSDGQTLSARQIAMAGINLNYDTGDTNLTPMSEFTVRLNDEGEVTLVLNGETWDFVPADREVEEGGEVYGYFTQAQCDDVGTCVSLFSYTGEIDDLKTNGNGHHEVLISQSNQINPGGQPDLKAFGIIGTETMDADLPTLGMVTYNGWSRIDGHPDEGFVNNGESRTRVQGDLAMTADFNGSTISGIIDNIETRGPGEESWASADGMLSMNETSFEVNGFIGSVTADAAFTDSTGFTVDTGVYSGVFYGPNAEEVAGVISATGLDDEGAAYNAVGFFSGNQD